MTRALAYIFSLLFLAAFFCFDLYDENFDSAIPYFAAVLFSLWSPVRTDIIVVSFLSFVTTMAGAYFPLEVDQTITQVFGQIFVDRSLSVFALVCVTYVCWQRRGISIRLAEMNQILEARVGISEKEAIEIQQQLSQVSSELDQHTVDRRKREKGLRQAIESYQSLIESLPLNVFQKNSKSKFTFANARFLETIGKSKRECLGKSDFDLFPKEQAEKYAADDRLVLANGEPLEDIEEHILRDGKKIYVQVFKAPIRNARKEIIGVQGMFWEVTDRIQAEQRQKETDARFRRLVNSNIIGIFTGLFDGKILDANNEFLQLLGYSHIDISENGLRWDELTPPEFHTVDQKMELEIVETGFCRPMEKEYFHKDGHRIPVLVGAVRVNNKTNEAICSVVDITNQKEAEQALKLAKDAADEANRSKSLFLANMSHEIRTPLNAIIGLTELVLEGRLAREQAEYLKMVKDSGEALLEIINDILDYSKVQAGKLKLEPEQFSLRTKMGELLRPLSIRAHEKGLSIVLDVAGDVSDKIYGDPVCLRQVVTNLVNNAVKFTEEGEVVVTVTVSDRIEKNMVLHIAVSDTGPGISTDLRKKIFNAFEQADNTSTRKFGGTGLGLAICSNLVELLGGEIWVESELGQGSTFHFTSSWEDRTENGNGLFPIESNLVSSVLIVDQHQRSLSVLQKVLQRWDLNVVGFSSADQAFDEILDSENDYQLMIADERTMEQLSLNRLQQFQKKKTALKIITLSTKLKAKNGDGESGKPLIESQFNLLKPIQESELFDAIASVVSPHENITTQFDDGEPYIPSLNILVAEDNLVNQRLAMAILSQRDHFVTLASDGAEAIELATRGDFDLVLMDIQMPNVDGIEATQKIREFELAMDKHTTIIALTAHAGESDRSRCLQAGMDGYVTKPLRPHDLMLEVKRLVKNGDTKVFEEPISVELQTKLKKKPLQKGSVNWSEALSQTANDEALLMELIEIFRNESPKIMGELEDAVSANDLLKIASKAHYLKGSFRVFCCEHALDLAQALEVLTPDDDAKAGFKKLETEYKVVFEELTNRKNRVQE